MSAAWTWVKARTMQHLHGPKGYCGISMPLPSNKNYVPDTKREEASDLILRALNSHDELVSALSHLIYASDNPVMGSAYEISRALPFARAALAKATKP